jgi:L-ascorbate metabolism protein UlaG (beta-lactamase superfamily)
MILIQCLALSIPLIADNFCGAQFRSVRSGVSCPSPFLRALFDTLKITVISGPTALLEVGGLLVLADPTFEPPGSYNSAVTLTKLTGPALKPEQIGRVDAVLLSHDQHFDYLDRSGRGFLPSAEIVWTSHSGAQRLGKNANGLAAWKTTQLRSPGGRIFQITATPARHPLRPGIPLSVEV